MIVVTEDFLKFHADYLRSFWKKHGLRHTPSPREWQDVIADLIAAGEVFYRYKNPNNTLEKRRTKFDKVKNKRQRYKLRPNQSCLACGELAYVRHHIIWLKNGGRNNQRNICFLCHSCHAQVHPWLQK